MVQHVLVVDVDVHLLALGEGFHEEVVGGVDGFNLARPRVGVLGIGEPSGLVARPFGGHEISLFFRGHSKNVQIIFPANAMLDGLSVHTMFFRRRLSLQFD